MSPLVARSTYAHTQPSALSDANLSPYHRSTPRLIHLGASGFIPTGMTSISRLTQTSERSPIPVALGVRAQSLPALVRGSQRCHSSGGGEPSSSNRPQSTSMPITGSSSQSQRGPIGKLKDQIFGTKEYHKEQKRLKKEEVVHHALSHP
jgi:hypothetical protein